MELWELAARESVRDLIARYNANADAGRYDHVLPLFAPDAVMEIRTGVFRGRDEIRNIFTTSGSVAKRREQFTHIRHFTSTLQIDILGQTTARSRCYYAVIMDHGIDHWGRYIDQFTCIDGNWLFSHRHVTMDGGPGSKPVMD